MSYESVAFKQVLEVPMTIKWHDTGSIEEQLIGIVGKVEDFDCENYENDDNIFYYMGIKEFLDITTKASTRQFGDWEVYYRKAGK